MATAIQSADDLTEKNFSRQIYDLVRTLGYRRYHTFRSSKSPAGFPDEVLVRERVVFLEVKRQTGRLSPPQREWITALLNGGAEVYVVRPDDLQWLAIVLAHRGDPWATGRGQVVTAASELRELARREAGA